ncbi:hypothetical protein NP493_1662g00000 [Ridgeia piscesae]|uniref:Nicastrin n=1 Tax=Ridgeia piscesae TaxID=27915 RepID=A0AAD9N9A4_RIDPI|nr:hypothetical protein NP493_1662g00000 [Ridgeia piscesae]
MFTVGGDRVKERIYQDVKAYSPCIRLLNGTHQIGCNSKRGGNVGTVHMVESQADVDWLVQHGPHAPYIPLLKYSTFTRDVINILTRSGKVNGILLQVVNDTEPPVHMSPDQACPNVGSEMYKNDGNLSNCQRVSWNKQGSGLMFEDLDIPVVLLHNESDVEFIIDQCYNKYNKPSASGEARSYPLCAMQLKVAMDAARDSPTCIRRSAMITNLNPQHYCDPLGDFNVYSFLHLPKVKDDLKPDSVIVAAARMDAFSFFLPSMTNSPFHNVPGADSVVTGLVTLLAVAEAIGKVKHKITKSDKPIMFTFFNGESFDYIGSSRMVYEMQRKNFPSERDPYFLEHPTKGWTESKDDPHPISLEHLYAMVELSQVGLNNRTWLHSDVISARKPAVKAVVDDMIKTLKKAAALSGVEVDIAPTGQPLPPASQQTFLKEKSLPGLLLADHSSSYTNKYYNSHLDVADQLGPEGTLSPHLTHLATVVAQLLYKMSTGKEDTNITADESSVSGLLHCFLKTAQCDMFNRTLNGEQRLSTLSKLPYSLYVSVSYVGRKNPLSVLVHNLLAYFLGDHMTNVTSASDCKAMNKKGDDKQSHPYTFKWMQGAWNNKTMKQESFCVRTIANYSTARSPAFDMEEYSWSSQKYSTWTESAWAADAMQVRIFLMPSKEREIAILCGGIGFFVISTFCLFVIRRKFDTIFDSSSE